MKTLATLLLLAVVANTYPSHSTAGPGPTKSETKASKKKAGKLFGKRAPESAYAKAMRRNELFR
ncbi:hypothetical protein [Hymenobacter rigui]|uniref:Uncharacterized protein n=1 Tax=Hymenobacter rigui TaxID=334424 RepID=A0A428KSP5_9BACT|nr:hypothetical protein [Hymenobacter rigui]RSK49543.1 hypothetical protein EI291_08615 [Hymenobacter rigui]